MILAKNNENTFAFVKVISKILLSCFTGFEHAGMCQQLKVCSLLLCVCFVCKVPNNTVD